MRATSTLQIAPRPPQAAEQFGGRPGIGRQAELDLHIAHRAAALQAEDAVGTPDVVAAFVQDLLQLAGLLEAELGNVAAATHDRRAVEAGGRKAPESSRHHPAVPARLLWAIC